MYMTTVITYDNGHVSSVTELDTAYTRYLQSPLLTDLENGSTLPRYYFTKDGPNGTRFKAIDYQGIERDVFPMITDRGAITYSIPGNMPMYQTYTFEYNRYMSLTPGL